VPTLDEVMSYHGGARVVVTGMISRKNMYRDAKPWLFWPGSIRNISYGFAIARIASEMGGDVNERPVW